MDNKGGYLRLMLITNEIETAVIAQKYCIDWIFVDLEINGKKDRQGHLDTVISDHHLEDIAKLRPYLKASKLLVRINPMGVDSLVEINDVIQAGADILMLPYFKNPQEVKDFVGAIGGRAQTCLLLETPEAVAQLDDILEVKGIDYVHIGLNDLHLGYGMTFMFEPLANGMVERICRSLASRGIVYGFGGVGRIGFGDLPAERILAEHYRLGSSQVILSRSFFNLSSLPDFAEQDRYLKAEIQSLREYETYIRSKDDRFFFENQAEVKQKVQFIVEHRRGIVGKNSFNWRLSL